MLSYIHLAAVNGTEKNNAIVPSIVDETKKKLGKLKQDFCELILRILVLFIDKKEKKKEKNGLKLQANANSTTDMSGLSNKNGNLSITDVATEFADVDVTVEDLDEAVAIDPKFLIHPDLPGPDHFCQPSWPSFMEHLPTRQNVCSLSFSLSRSYLSMN